ncbi:hypothetical protein AMJ85_01940 [candidate division BRC1 bacterium SM23_51]|nr:MAG: hypothetical protein AMJ85_01940 [candidate division BRC1 bacterium SM23_51]
MRRIRKFLSLPAADQWLLLKSAVLLGSIRLGLWLLPFQTMRRVLARMGKARACSKETDEALVERVVRAVSLAGRHVPGTRSCLVQSLGAQVLLARRGWPVRLRIGVARGEKGQFQAHAWLESRGKVIIGGTEDLSRYTPLSPLET